MEIPPKAKKEKWLLNKLQDAFKKLGKKVKITSGCRSFLLGLAHFANKEGECYPLQSQLEQLTGLTKDNQYILIAKLKQKRFISIKRRYDKERKMTRNYYKIHLDIILNIELDEQNKPTNVTAEINTSPNFEPNPLFNNCSNTEPTLLNEPCTNTEPTLLNEPCTNTEPTLLSRVGSPYISTTHENKSKSILDNVHLQANEQHLSIVESGSNVTKLRKLDLFEEFWIAYPRKQARRDARKAWDGFHCEIHFDEIIADIYKRYEHDVQWQNKEFIPLAGTYLRGERWKDEIINKSQNEVTNGKQTSNYIEQLKRVGNNIAQRTATAITRSDVISSLQNNMGGKVDKKY